MEGFTRSSALGRLRWMSNTIPLHMWMTLYLMFLLLSWLAYRAAACVYARACFFFQLLCVYARSYGARTLGLVVGMLLVSKRSKRFRLYRTAVYRSVLSSHHFSESLWLWWRLWYWSQIGCPLCIDFSLLIPWSEVIMWLWFSDLMPRPSKATQHP